MRTQASVVVILLLLWGFADGYHGKRRSHLPEKNDQTTTSIPSLTGFGALIQKYDLNFNASKVLQKDDRKFMSSWADEYQVKRLDVCLKYRMQMVKHEEHSFRIDRNTKWMKCLSGHRKDVRWSRRFYHDKEMECLKTSTSSDAGRIADVEQLEKQIMQWRKGYKYLVNLCDMENPNNTKDAQQCLVQYMQSDKYDELVERLMILKQTAISDLYAYYNASLIQLEECLKTQLSKYLERVRLPMKVPSKLVQPFQRLA